MLEKLTLPTVSRREQGLELPCDDMESIGPGWLSCLALPKSQLNLLKANDTCTKKTQLQRSSEITEELSPRLPAPVSPSVSY